MKEGAEEKHNREAWMSEELRNDGEKGKEMKRLTYQSFGKEGSVKAEESYFFQFILLQFQLNFQEKSNRGKGKTQFCKPG